LINANLSIGFRRERESLTRMYDLYCEGFWLGLQNDFDIEEEKQNIKTELELIEAIN